jgi:hypothetical protein
VARMESAMDCGRSEEEQRACKSLLHSSMGGTRLAALYWNQSLHLDLTRRAVSSPAFLMALLKSSCDISVESVAMVRRTL